MPRVGVVPDLPRGAGIGDAIRLALRTTAYLFGPGIDEPLAMINGVGAYFFGVDSLGSISFLTDSDGNTVDSYVYDAWGVMRERIGSTPNPFTFTSRETDVSGLMYYRARYYSAAIGRFLAEDSAAPGGASLYSYVLNNPSDWTDPSGHVAIKDNIDEVPLLSGAIPLKCPLDTRSCTIVQYENVWCQCPDPDGNTTCPPAVPIYPRTTLVFGGLMYLPKGGEEWARNHENNCHVYPATDAAYPILEAIERTSFYSKEDCEVGCMLAGAEAVSAFRNKLDWTQEPEQEYGCKSKVR